MRGLSGLGKRKGYGEEFQSALWRDDSNEQTFRVKRARQNAEDHDPHDLWNDVED